MIENGETEKNPRPTNPALNFVFSRMSASTASDRHLVGRLIHEKVPLPKAFSQLVGELEDSRISYSLEGLASRDRYAWAHVEASGVTEPSEIRTISSRPDRGIPSPLELYFLTLFTNREWEDLCKEEEIISDLGALTTRNVIEAVLADEPRTKKFVRAIQHEMHKLEENPATVYDIGCGAFPILGLSAALHNPRARVVGLEINPLSARIAQALINKFVERGNLQAGQVKIMEADALEHPLPPKGSIDLLVSDTFGAGLMDEKGTELIARYAPLVNSTQGAIIPHRAKLAATVWPLDIGITHDNTGKRVSKYSRFVLNPNGQLMAVIPRNEWSDLEGGREMPIEEIPREIKGTLNFPANVSAVDFNRNYGVAVASEFILDSDGKNGLSRYESHVTSPALLGSGVVTVPENLKGEDPSRLAISFALAPGTDSRTARAEVVRKREG